MKKCMAAVFMAKQANAAAVSIVFVRPTGFVSIEGAESIRRRLSGHLRALKRRAGEAKDFIGYIGRSLDRLTRAIASVRKKIAIPHGQVLTLAAEEVRGSNEFSRKRPFSLLLDSRNRCQFFVDFQDYRLNFNKLLEMCFGTVFCTAIYYRSPCADTFSRS